MPLTTLILLMPPAFDGAVKHDAAAAAVVVLHGLDDASLLAVVADAVGRLRHQARSRTLSDRALTESVAVLDRVETVVPAKKSTASGISTPRRIRGQGAPHSTEGLLSKSCPRPASHRYTHLGRI